MKRTIQIRMSVDGYIYQALHDGSPVSGWEFGGQNKEAAITEAKGRFGQDYELEEAASLSRV